MQHIPLVDLKAQYHSIKAEIDEAMAHVMANTAFIMGKAVTDFENAFAQYAHAKHAIGVANGTEALMLAYQVAGLKHGDEVITTPHTFIASVSTLAHVGIKPVFVDIDPHTYNIDPNLIEKAITPKTKAIVPVHLYGQPANMDEIARIAQKHNLMIIEDAAQAHGAEWNGKRVGSWGAMTGFSFYPGKNLGAAGDAGGIITNDDNHAKALRLLINHGSENKYTHQVLGYNARMDGLQGAVLGVKMKYIEQWTEQRRANAEYYDELLSSVSDIITPKADPRARHVYHLYVIRVPRQRDAFLKHLQDNNIGAGIHYPLPLHMQPAFAHLGYQHGDFPITESLAESIISLPLYPELTHAQMETVVDVVKDALNVVG
jgi:dTDP-4-amino-4,6-dideoxygalactose transaminase